MQTACQGFMQELGVLKRGGRYFRKIPDSVGVQVRLSRERTNVFSNHYHGFLVTVMPFMKQLSRSVV